MTSPDRPGTRRDRLVTRDRLIAVGIVAGFLVLVTAVLAVYVGGMLGLHPRLHAVVPALVRASRIPSLAPAALVLGAAIAVMAVAFIVLLIRDAREVAPDATPSGNDAKA